MLFGKINHPVAVTLCAIFVLFSLQSLEARAPHHSKHTDKHKMRRKKVAFKTKPLNIHFGPGPGAKKQFNQRGYPINLRNQNAPVNKK